MKLTTPESIREREKEFIDTINAELDWEAIEKLLLQRHNFTLQDEVDYKNGDLIVHNNEIAYRFEFEIKVPLSLIFNRQGHCLDISTLRDDVEPVATDSVKEDFEAVKDGPDGQKNRVKQMASNIATMIHEINNGDIEA